MKSDTNPYQTPPPTDNKDARSDWKKLLKMVVLTNSVTVLAILLVSVSQIAIARFFFEPELPSRYAVYDREVATNNSSLMAISFAFLVTNFVVIYDWRKKQARSKNRDMK
jgi:hypothetical protein